MSARVTRCDTGELAKPVRDAEGFLQVEGVLARACILEYHDAQGGPRHELVTPEVLFEDASMRSLAAKALTNEHPSALLTPDTVGSHQIGSIGEPRRDGDRLVSLLGILRADAIAAVEAGKAELSCGYSCTIDETPGEHPTLRCPQCGTAKYDGVQRDRRGNHVAIVSRARAGDTARMRLDAAGNACLTPSANHETLPFVATQQSPTEPTMPDLRIDGITIKPDAADAQQVIDRALATIRADAAKATDAEKVRADKAAADLADKAKRLDAVIAGAKQWRAKARATLDAMMKRAVTCDECGGTGKLDDGSKCPSCDGAGTHSARDTIKAMPAAAEGEHPEEDAAEMEAMPEDGFEAAPDDKPADPKAAEAKKDAARKRADARKIAHGKRADMFNRTADRRAQVRAALLTEAALHLDGADVKGKPDAEIKRAVLAKIAPHLDAAKLDAASVDLMYAAEIKRGAIAINGAAPSLAMSNGTLPAARTDDRALISKTIAATEAAMNPWAQPAGKQ